MVTNLLFVCVCKNKKQNTIFMFHIIITTQVLLYTKKTVDCTDIPASTCHFPAGNVHCGIRQCPYAIERMPSDKRYLLSSIHGRQTLVNSRVVTRCFSDLNACNLHVMLLQRLSTCRYCSWRTFFLTYALGIPLALR